MHVPDPELSREEDPSSPLAPGAAARSRRRGWRIGGFLLTALLILCGIIVLNRQRGGDVPSPPVVDLDGSHALVRAAVEDARQAVLVQPDSAEAWGSYGMCLYAHAFTPAAISCFEQAEQLDAGDYRWPYLSGLCTTFTDPERGRDCFDRAARLAPELVFVRLRAAELLIDLNQPEPAQRHVEAARAREPNNPRAALAAARLAFARGDLDESRSWASQCVERAPDATAAYELLARICFQQGDHAAAREYQRLLQQRGGSDPAWPDPLVADVMELRRDEQWLLFRLQEQRDRGQAAQAVETLRWLVGEFPDSVESRIELTQALWSLDRNAEAADALDEALQRIPNSARLHRLRGVLDRQQGAHARAAAAFRRAIELKPDYALARYELGKCLVELEDHAGALREFEAALALQPELPGIAEELALLRQRELE